MIIPIVNAIFDEEIDISDFYKPKTKIKNDIENIIFRRVDAKIFPIIKLKDRVNEYPSTSIIINSTNEGVSRPISQQ
jgi:1-deoxy-D-xylulose 5-phosphate reductoisomerase